MIGKHTNTTRAAAAASNKTIPESYTRQARATMMPRRHTEMSTATNAALAPFDFMALSNPHGLRFLEGGEGDGAVGEGSTSEGQQSESAPSPAELAAQQAAAQQTNGAETDAAKIARLEQSVKDANAEAARSRVRGKTAADEAQSALAQQIGKALGLVSDDPATPEQLAQQVTEATTARETAETAAKAAQVELAVFRAAGAAGADPAALLDSTSFTRTLADVDPTDPAAITAAIKTAVTNNPRLRAQAAGASSADHAGGSGEGAITKERFDTMSGAERNRLYTSDPATYNRLTGR